jgi:hypothetical protein
MERRLMIRPALRAVPLVLVAAFLPVPALAAQAVAPPPPAAPAEGAGPAESAAPGTSRITHVVVYPEHAEITRQITVDAVPGPNTVRFTNLIPLLDADTLRASVSAGARISGTGIQKVFLKESVSEEINALEQRIQELADQLLAETNGKARLTEQAAFYAAVKGRVAGDVTRELTESRLGVADWEQLLAFVNDGLQRCDEQHRAAEVRVRALTKELTAATDERKEFAGRQPKEMREVEVAFHAERGGATDV